MLKKCEIKKEDDLELLEINNLFINWKYMSITNEQFRIFKNHLLALSNKELEEKASEIWVKFKINFLTRPLIENRLNSLLLTEAYELCKNNKIDLDSIVLKTLEENK